METFKNKHFYCFYFQLTTSFNLNFAELKKEKTWRQTKKCEVLKNKVFGSPCLKLTYNEYERLQLSSW